MNPRPLGYEQADRRPSPSRPVAHTHAGLNRRGRAVSTCLTLSGSLRGVLVTITVTRAPWVSGPDYPKHANAHSLRLRSHVRSARLLLLDVLPELHRRRRQPRQAERYRPGGDRAAARLHRQPISRALTTPARSCEAEDHCSRERDTVTVLAARLLPAPLVAAGGRGGDEDEQA